MEYVEIIVLGTLAAFLVMSFALWWRDRRLLRLLPLVLLACGELVLFEVYLATRLFGLGSANELIFLFVAACVGIAFCLVAIALFRWWWPQSLGYVAFQLGLSFVLFGSETYTYATGSFHTTTWEIFLLAVGYVGLLIMFVSLLQVTGAFRFIANVLRSQNDLP